jgi:lauroyl/myristoyl acyltransferase
MRRKKRLNLAQLTSSHLGVALGDTLGRLLPLRSGLALADWVADRISSRLQAPEVQAVRFNQQILTGGQLSPAELDERVRAVFRNSARGVLEVLHYQYRPAKLLRKVEVDEALKGYIQLTQDKKERVVFSCPHTGNFDLAGRALGLMGLRAFILAEPTPRADYKYLNRVRRRTGLTIATISMESLRAAAQFLEDGGSVLTGVDWPVAEKRYRPRFCGRPSLLPTAHIRLAVKVGATVVVVACHRRPDGKYFIASSEPIPMRAGSSMMDTILSNTETVLDVVEPHIRYDPEQWLMFRPVWEAHDTI